MTRHWLLSGVVSAIVGLVIAASVGADAPPEAVDPDTPAPVTLSTHDTDIREVLALFSRSRGLNIVTSGEVEGRISVDLHEVPFHDALRAVVGMAGFEVIRRGDIYFIGNPPGHDPGASLLRDTRTFRLSYALPEDITPVFEKMKSPIGRITAYLPLRTIVVEDLPDVLERMERVLSDLDHAPRQVLIEARMIEVSLRDDLAFGIDWSAIFSSGSGQGDANQSGFASPPTATNQGLFISWADVDFTAELEALEEVEDLKTLSSPRVLAVDGVPAEVIVGSQLGFRVTTTVENVVMESVQFLDTGAQLRLTPTITGDDHVLMTVNPELSDGKIELGLPSKTTAQVTTDALVRNGQTLFIGGLIREREEETQRGVPILMRIPLLGRLFGRTVQKTFRSEIVTLITPHIVEPGKAPSLEHLPEMQSSIE
jgi:type II secretory pathway component GspD/PulD (secretin)